jgi:transcriptional regulator with XRE-family HTH domain
MADKDNSIEPNDAKPIDPKTVIAWREAMGYSQRDAAEALGCSRASIQNWEQGINECPRYIGLAMAALALGMHPYGSGESDKEENGNGNG